MTQEYVVNMLKKKPLKTNKQTANLEKKKNIDKKPVEGCFRRLFMRLL